MPEIAKYTVWFRGSDGIFREVDKSDLQGNGRLTRAAAARAVGGTQDDLVKAESHEVVREVGRVGSRTAYPDDQVFVGAGFASLRGARLSITDAGEDRTKLIGERRGDNWVRRAETVFDIPTERALELFAQGVIGGTEHTQYWRSKERRRVVPASDFDGGRLVE